VLEGLRGEHRVSLPPGRHRSGFVLPLEQGVSRSGEEALARGHPARSHLDRSHGPSQEERTARHGAVLPLFKPT
jgi:hypothetical protein